MGERFTLILKRIIEKHPGITRCLLMCVSYFPLNNRYRFLGAGNRLKNRGLLMRSEIRVKGKSNTIEIGSMTRIYHTKIIITGSNNRIHIGNECYLMNADMCIEDSNGTIEIGYGTSICGTTHLACIEGKRIVIGKECLFSSGVVVRTGDSHSILDSEGKRINHSKNVIIGDHVWVGNQTTILKGAIILEDSIVGTGAIVTKAFEEGNIV